ncbi:hypothetical protein [uncultured Psychrobacter sp.]|uniref:hypothetical protein n=1 Tax=uncultured Psychrobacter sp. TaxID=259303 RepID=UPI001B4393C4|nr:hypothetical protein [uncultured Psychrobacter sp.]MBP7942789.1 hypothetical protein [Psychrobacter sp.]MBP8046543.1 hypothetical protein [Psychrobacter sp.]MDN5694435.1 hypothetical protein [Psychrobacter sp.]
MTQHSTSDDGLSSADFMAAEEQFAEGHAEQSAHLANSQQPAIVHPNFDPKRLPIDPARPLTDIPEPARRLNGQLRRLYGRSTRFYQPKTDSLSKWALVASEALAEHLSLLSAAKLIELPESFYHNHSDQPLLSPLTDMTLLDMADIQRALQAYPKLTRYGFARVDSINIDNNINKPLKTESLRALTRRYNPDELLNSVYADDWQVVLQPQQFDSGAGSLATDIMACSVAVHALKQCSTRKTINHSYSAAQICQHLRSYLLSQIVFEPAQRHAYRQVRLFTGHIIVAAYHLGWDIQVSHDGQCYFTISSRCGLLTRYANMQDYDINGWSS